MWEGGITPARDAMTALTQQTMYFFPVTIRYLFFTATIMICTLFLKSKILLHHTVMYSTGLKTTCMQ